MIGYLEKKWGVTRKRSESFETQMGTNRDYACTFLNVTVAW